MRITEKLTSSGQYQISEHRTLTASTEITIVEHLYAKIPGGEEGFISCLLLKISPLKVLLTLHNDWIMLQYFKPWFILYKSFLNAS